MLTAPQCGSLDPRAVCLAAFQAGLDGGTNRITARGMCSRQGDDTETLEFGDVGKSGMLGRPQTFHIVSDGNQW